MNRLKRHLRRASLVLLLGPLASFANAADAIPTYKYARVTTVNITDRAALKNVMEAWTPFVKKEFPKYHTWQFRTDDSQRASWVESGNELSDFERIDQEFQTAVKKYQEMKLPDLRAAWLRSFIQVETTIWENLPDLNYAPPGDNAWEQNFRMIGVFHLKPEKEQAFVDALTAFNELDRRAGINHPRRVYKLRYGLDMPAIALVTPAKDAAGYHTGFAKRQELRLKDPKGKELLETLEQCVQRRENRHVTVHPEFSKRYGE